MVYGAGGAARRRREQEEEEMISYPPDELQKYEYKIVRSTFGAFGNPAKFNQLLQEEARAGWELVEKFDDRRVRFRRLISARERDSLLPVGVDPYRSYVGITPLRFVLLLLISIVVLMAVICALTVEFRQVPQVGIVLLG